MTLTRVLSEEPHPIRYIASRILPGMRLGGLTTCERHGYRIRLHDAVLSRYAFSHPEWEREEEQFVGSFLKPGDTFVDVGANIGLLSLRAAKKVGPTGRVLAVEAHPRTFSYLKSNVRLNRRSDMATIEPFCYAAGKYAAQTLCMTDGNDDTNAIIPNAKRASTWFAPRGLAYTESIPIDHLWETGQFGNVALLKVDVEGFELPAFQGASRMLERTEAVLFESCERHANAFSYSCRDVFDLLRNAGFGIYRITAGRTIGEPIPDSHVSTDVENLIAVRNHRQLT